MGASTVIGFKPPNCKVSFQPVQYESVYALSGSVLADGRGVLTWGTGPYDNYYLRVAVVSPDKWLMNGSVTPADTMTLESTASNGVTRRGGPSSWAFGNTHYIMSSYGHTSMTRIWKSTDLVTWSIVGTFGGHGASAWQNGGVILHRPLNVNGRWFVLYNAAAGIGPGYDVGMYNAWMHTENEGATQNGVVLHQYGWFEDDIMPSHVVQVPQTGDIIFKLQGNNADRSHMVRSSNLGGSWEYIGFPSWNVMPFLDDGEYVYAFHGNNVRRSNTPLVPGEASWPIVGQHNAGTLAMHLRVGGQDMYFDAGSRIYVDRGGWQVGSLGFG